MFFIVNISERQRGASRLAKRALQVESVIHSLDNLHTEDVMHAFPSCTLMQFLPTGRSHFEFN